MLHALNVKQFVELKRLKLKIPIYRKNQDRILYRMVKYKLLLHKFYLRKALKKSRYNNEALKTLREIPKNNRKM